MKKQCGTCKNFEPTGRGMAGHCQYPVPWPVLPEAYIADEYGRASWPMKAGMYPQDGQRCKVYEAK